jgi:hypothetical protein
MVSCLGSNRWKVRAFAVFGEEAVDPRRDNGQRHRASSEHSIVERADVEFCSERLLRFFTNTPLRLTQPPLHRFAAPFHECVFPRGILRRRYPMRGKRIPILMQMYRTRIAPSVERMRPAG